MRHEFYKLILQSNYLQNQLILNLKHIQQSINQIDYTFLVFQFQKTILNRNTSKSKKRRIRIKIAFTKHIIMMKLKNQQTQQRESRLKSHKSQQFQKSQTIFRKTYDGYSKGNKNQKISINDLKSNLKCGIQNKYLNPLNYMTTCQFAKKRNCLYKNYCTIIKDYYIEFKLIYEKFSQFNKGNNKATIQKSEKINFVKQFKCFLLQFFSIFSQVSNVHIQYFSLTSDQFSQKQEILQYNTQQLIQKLKNYDKSQKQFQQSSKTHSTKLNQISILYQSLKKDQKDPYCFFNKKSLTKKAKQLLQTLSRQQKIRQLLRKDLDQVYQNSMDFQNNLIIYRQQLFSNKYKIMKKLAQVSRSAKNGLAQLLVYLFDCVSRRNQQFLKCINQTSQKRIRKKSKSISHNQDKLAIQSYLIQITNDYSRKIAQIQNILKSIAQFLQELRKFTLKQSENNNKMLELLNVVYDADQNQNKDVFDALEFYFYFCKKICELNNGINIASNQLTKLKNQTKKLSQITLSLVRNKSQKLKDYQFDKQGDNHNSQIQILLQKMSFDYPMSIISKIYKHFQQILSFLKNHASQKFHMKKKIVQDSMEISYLEQTLIKPQKKPCKKELWLWEKWQNQNNFKIDQFRISNLAQVKQYAAKLIQQHPQAKQLDRYSCSIEVKGQTSGFLIITDKYIKFQTSQGNCILLILLTQIDDVKIVVRIFGKIILVDTSYGSVAFKGCLNPQGALQSIQEAKSNSGAPATKPPRIAVQITAQQLSGIEQRKTKFKQILPKVQDFVFRQDVIIQNISIDHLYELIYSDNQVNIRGKKQSMFFAYVMKKSGASNYQATKYDSIGPKFYTHEQGVTFVNSPLFSTRIINYDVKMPPIPFMPKYAQNRQQCKLFWISNTQFQYYFRNNTSGVPKSNTFYLQVLHKIQKVEQKRVKISMYSRIVFTEDSYLKSTIESNATEQSIKGLAQTVVQIKKYCHQMTSFTNKQGAGSQQIVNDGLQQQKQNLAHKGGSNKLLSTLIQKIASLANTALSLFNKGQTNLKSKDTNSNQTNGNQKLKINSTTQKGKLSPLIIVLVVILVLNLFVSIFKSSQQ